MRGLGSGARAPAAHRAGLLRRACCTPAVAARSRARRGLLQCSAGDAQRVPVRFSLRKEVNYGQQLRVVGSAPGLGSWDATRGLQLKWSDGHVWSGEAELEAGGPLEFKVVCVGKEGRDVWEDGNNRSVKTLSPGHSLDVHCIWGRTADSDVESREVQEGQPHFDDLAAATARNEDRRQQLAAAVARASRSLDSYSDSDESGPSAWVSGDEDQLSPAWQGREVRFMRSNDHSHERAGRWDTSGLASGPVLELVRGDERAPNWLGKLGVARALLVDAAPKMRPDVDALASALVYLSWVNSGALPCAEGGGHFRPNHHARTAQQIFRSLEWAIEDDRLDGAAAGGAPRLRSLLARRLHARLPSFNASFTQAVPLTRIRDIAHRGDIPHELKQEIKHTLQNKLHRNAGPEDLVATQAMLARITESPGQYSGAFVEEFRVFTAELRDFFNAGGLTTTLEGLRDVITADPADAQVLDSFLGAKARLDGMGDSAPLAELMAVSHAATTLRALLLRSLSSGLRNDAPDAALAMRQRYRLAELRCEEYLFVLMSRFINALEGQGGAGALASTRSDIAWSHPLAMLLLGVRNLGLGGWMPGECMALENEITAWQQDGSFDERDNALRLKATLERCLRLTEGYTDTLLSVLPQRAEQLGAALGVEDWVVRTFTEGEVRSSLVFQLSKLGALLLVAARALAGVTPWDTLVSGTAVGRLLEAARLDPAALQGETGPVVLLLRAADGDEEVAAAGRCVQGIVLTQELPHLSHLGVRARQERVPFVTIEDRGVIAQQVTPLLGQQVALVASPEGTTLRLATAAEAASAAAAVGGSNGSSTTNGNGNGVAAAVAPLRTTLATKPGVVALLDCTSAVGGAKSAACARLEQLAAKSSASPSGGFKTPPGVCVPFGTMELAIAALPADRRARYAELLSAAETAAVAELDDICNELQAFLRGVAVPDAVLRGVMGSFPPGSPLIARSSANVEDLAGMSGAGLYDSVPNVPSDRPQDIAAAIAEVWASLHTRRAVLSRRAGGVRQSDATMAVLVQAMLAPQLSFVLHTASPLGDAPGTAVAEVAAGLGETLASGARGSAWRLAVDKDAGSVTTLAFANFTQALLPAQTPVAAGAAGGGAPAGALHACSVQLLDYSQAALSRSVEARKQLGGRLGGVAAVLEREFGGPQDVEGCMLGDAVFVVQTRPQPM
ncbi:MAG: pyruvate phosphate dikinase [Monoraphidium minutum]|nr:MAG: pyruvate phosphate dikinase [Monoraphidium minutum]